MKAIKVSPGSLVVLAGITAALHVGKLPPAIPALQETLAITLVQAGFLVSLVQLAGMSLGLIIGLSADALGLRRSMLTGLGLLTLASLLGGLAESAGALLFCRALEGLGFLLTVLPAPGLLRQLVPAERLNRILGVWGCYMGIGMGTALLIGPWVIAGLGWQGWWWCLALWTALMLPCLLAGVPADRQRQAARALAPVNAEGWGRRLSVTLRARGPWLVALCFGLYACQWLSVIGFLPSIYHQAGFSGGQVGVLTALVATINVIGSLGAGQLMHRGIAANRLLLTGFLATGLFTFLAYSTLTEVLPLLRFATILLFSAMGGLIPGALFALAVRLAPSERTISTTVGWMQQWSAFGQFAGPPGVAWLAAQAGGWHWTWAITGACSLLGILLALRIARLLGQATVSEPSPVAVPADRAAASSADN